LGTITIIRITYQGRPAIGVTLGIELNAKYKAKELVTDSDGIFTLNLPPGNWTINSIDTKSWKDKPNGRGFTLYFGDEEKLINNQFNRYGSYQKNGHSVAVTTETKTPHLNIIISTDIQMIWPTAEDKTRQASIDDIISWEKYPDASQYRVEIKKLTREGNITRYESVTSKTLSQQTALSLSSLKYIKYGFKLFSRKKRKTIWLSSGFRR